MDKDGDDFPPRGGGRGHGERPPMAKWKSGADLPSDWDYLPGMFLLGHDGTPQKMGRRLGLFDNRHAITIAGSRSGKTLSLLIPNLKTYPGSAVVIDPKGELALATAEHRRAMGQRVFVLNPLPMPRSRLERSASYNPFADLKRALPETLPADVAQLADAAIISNEKDPHWTDSAKSAWAGLTMLEHLKSPGEATIRKLRATPTDPRKLLEAWTAMSASDAYDGRLQAIGRTFLAKTEGEDGSFNRELTSIISSALEQTRPLDDVAHVSDRSDFSFEEFGTQPTTVYLVLPALRIATHAKWLRMIIYQLLAAVERNPIPVDPEKGQWPLRLVLEEFASLGYMSAIETAAGYIAGFGVQLWAVFQDLTQIHRHYPSSWETFLGNAGIINAFNVIDGTTTRYLSGLLGNTTILEARQTRLNASGVRGGDPGFDASPRSVPLLEPAEITKYFARETGRQLVLVPGQDPIFMQRLPWSDTNG